MVAKVADREVRMVSNEDHRARLVIVEHRLEQMSGQVSELSHNINKWMKEVSSAPRPIPFKEIVATALSTLLLFGSILAFLDARSATAIELVRLKDAEVRRLVEYRLDQVERRVNPPVTLMRPVQ